MGKRELIALLNLSSWCLVMVERLFLTVPRGCLQFVIVVFPDHTLLLFLRCCQKLTIRGRQRFGSIYMGIDGPLNSVSEFYVYPGFCKLSLILCF